MSHSIGTTTVEAIMVTVVLTVNERGKMEDVAKLFDERDINAAPVVDNHGVCVGVISSRDLVRYESVRSGIEHELARGSGYDQSHYGDGSQPNWPGCFFEEVGFHMSTNLETAETTFPVSRAARTMCQKHMHHIIVLDSAKHPIGIISSLDILGHIVGEPVSRRTGGETKPK